MTTDSGNFLVPVIMLYALISLLLLPDPANCQLKAAPSGLFDPASGVKEQQFPLSEDSMVSIPWKGVSSNDALLDYLLNKQALHRLSSGSNNRQMEVGKRNRFRLCSVNAVACFGRKRK